MRVLLRDRAASVTMIGAGAMLMALGCAAFAVDLGSIWVRTRALQGAADAAAIAAAQNLSDPAAAARAAAAASGWDGPVAVAVTPGHYRFDDAVAPGQRFTAASGSPDAVKVTLSATAPAYFALAWMTENRVPIARSATAARARLASFSIGSRLAAVDGGLAGQYLSQLAGIDLQLSVMDYNALLGADLGLLRFSDALATRLHLTGLSFAELLASEVTLPQLFGALGDALGAQGDATAAAAARQIAARVPGQAVTLSRLIDPGPYGAQDSRGGSGAADMNAYGFTRALLELAAGGRQVKLDLGAGIPGLFDTSLWIAAGERPANSPWLTVTDHGEPIVRTAQTRVYVEAKTPGIAGIGRVRLPLYIELASAEAKLADIGCGGGSAGQTLALDVRPSIGHASVADIDPTRLGDHQTPLAEGPATLVDLALVKVHGQARVDLGGVGWQRLNFSAADIASHRPLTVSTNDLAAGLAASLIRAIKLDVQLIGLPIGLGGVGAAVGGALATAAGPVDQLLGMVTDLVGIRLGQADVRIEGVRCGRPALVA
ncbi:TadG family pilus assembly protein [Sphingomonas flavalba]|uniref:TadG family pilus assembly protein n=1 Tax=Sphingomonas flavalba TaxID=2559804 RepID=UPI00109D8322|nr:TadG family pilus assembly protein [Sphingomonas flavalba]